MDYDDERSPIIHRRRALVGQQRSHEYSEDHEGIGNKIGTAGIIAMGQEVDHEGMMCIMEECDMKLNELQPTSIHSAINLVGPG